jgi:hypothetical protein
MLKNNSNNRKYNPIKQRKVKTKRNPQKSCRRWVVESHTGDQYAGITWQHEVLLPPMV